MIGDMIAKARKEKNMSKTQLSKLTKIDIGHLTHIEKGERIPSHRALKSICKALDVPYQTFMFMYDKATYDEQDYYKIFRHMTYNRVLAFENIADFIECPSSASTAAVAVKMPDSSMEPKIKKGDYLFVELNASLSSNDLAIVQIRGQIYVRKFVVRADRLILKSDNKDYKSINFSEYDEFNIIGKVVGIKKN